MEQKTVSPLKSSLTYGLYLGLILVLISVIFYVTNDPFNKTQQWITYFVMVGGVVYAQLNYRKLQYNVMTYSQALVIGLLTMIFASIITGFFTYLLYAIIDPSLQDQLRLSIEEQIVKQGNVPEEQLDMAIDMAAKFQKPAIMFVMSIISGTFVGLIISLITSIFTQKKQDDINLIEP